MTNRRMSALAQICEIHARQHGWSVSIPHPPRIPASSRAPVWGVVAAGVHGRGVNLNSLWPHEVLLCTLMAAEGFSMAGTFFDEQSDQSQIKAAIVADYFWAWAKVIIA